MQAVLKGDRSKNSHKYLGWRFRLRCFGSFFFIPDSLQNSSFHMQSLIKQFIDLVISLSDACKVYLLTAQPGLSMLYTYMQSSSKPLEASWGNVLPDVYQVSSKKKSFFLAIHLLIFVILKIEVWISLFISLILFNLGYISSVKWAWWIMIRLI